MSMLVMATGLISRKAPWNVTEASNPCHWGSVKVVDADLATRDDLLALGVYRVKSIGKREEDETVSAIAIFSDRGWV